MNITIQGKKVEATILRVTAKCADLFNVSLEDNKGKIIGEYDGYVPKFMPGEHYGDYVELEINIDTGLITNWNTCTKTNLEKVFDKQE